MRRGVYMGWHRPEQHRIPERGRGWGGGWGGRTGAIKCSAVRRRVLLLVIMRRRALLLISTPQRVAKVFTLKIEASPRGASVRSPGEKNTGSTTLF